MRALVLLLTCAVAVPASAAPRPRVMVLDTEPTESSLTRLVRPIVEAVSAELLATGRYDVMTSADVATMIGVERQKQLLGCDDDSGSCLAEIGSALGARQLVRSSLSKVGGTLRLDLKLLDLETSRLTAQEVIESDDEATLVDRARGAVRRLMGLGSGVSRTPGVAALAGGAAVASGAIAFGLLGKSAGDERARRLQSAESLPYSEAEALRTTANRYYVIAGAGVAASVALIAVGTWLLWGRE